MKAVLTRSTGSLDGLFVGDAPDPSPGRGEILVAVRAAGVNPADWKIVEMGFPGWQLPKAIGLDAAGVVAATGLDEAEFAPGDRVYFHGSFAGLGAFAERVVAPSHVVARLPDDVSFEAAAALPTAGFTAYQVIEDRFALGASDSVLVHAGAGGLGGFAIQLARRRGATVIATCSERNFEFVRSIGADHCIDYRRADIAAEVARITGGRGVDAILDAVGPSVAGAAIPMLAFQGHLACCVGLPDLSVLQPLPRGIRICDIALGGAYIRGDRRAQARLAHYGRELAALVAAGSVDPMISSVVDLDQAIEALRENRTGGRRGKVVIRVA